MSNDEWRDVTENEVLEAMEVGCVYGTGELAEEFGVPRRTMYGVLSRLHEDDLVVKRKPDARTCIWMLA